jgi:ligand-binding sensor domain-containing protein
MRTETRAIILILAGALLAAAGCATRVAPSYAVYGSSPSTPGGPVLALAARGEQVAVATNRGLYLRKGDGPWTRVQVPGLKSPKRVSCLAFNEDEIFLGTDGEGLFIYTGGTWEVKTEKYGGLPDDSVLSVAVDGDNEGLPGKNIWVGTKKGLALRRDGEWKLFTPKGDWLTELVGPSVNNQERYFVPSGSRIGRAGEDRKTFRPPVTAISIGPERVALGSRSSKVAVVEESRFATVALDGDREITTLLLEGDILWCGTSKGLLWAQLYGMGKGKPYPSWRSYVPSRTTLFGGRDARFFTFIFYQVGYNEAQVEDLVRDNQGGLWVAFADRSGSDLDTGPVYRAGSEQRQTAPISGVWRLISIDEYIAVSRQEAYELYGSKQGVTGTPSELENAGENGGIWVGTSKVLVNLKR